MREWGLAGRIKEGEKGERKGRGSREKGLDRRRRTRRNASGPDQVFLTCAHNSLWPALYPKPATGSDPLDPSLLLQFCKPAVFLQKYNEQLFQPRMISTNK